MNQPRWLPTAEGFIFAGTIGALVLPPFGGDASEIALGVAVLAWLVRGVGARVWEIPRVAAAAVFALFATDLLRSAITSGDVSASLQVAQYYPLRLATFLVAAVAIRHPRALAWLGWATVVVCAWCLLEGLVQRATGESLLRQRTLDHGRVRLNFTHPNDVTLFVVLAPLAITALLDSHRDAEPRLRWASRGAATFVALSAGVLVILAGSRSGILAAGAAVGVASLALFKMPQLAATFGVGTGGIAAAWALNLGHLKERVAGLMNPPWDPRLGIWAVDTAMWKEHPLLGRGTGTFHLGYEATLARLSIPADWQIYPEPIVHPHGLFMSALVERGALGLLVLATLVGVAGWALVKARRAQPGSLVPVGVAAALAGLLVAGVAEFWLGRRWVLITFVALVGMACGLQGAGAVDKTPSR